MLKLITATATLVGLVACTSTPEPTPGPISGHAFTVTHVRVFDGSRTIDDATVVVRNGLIEAAGAQIDVPNDLPLIDGSGKTLVPGFIDAHTHTYYEGALVDALRFGVTTELDMLTSVNFAARYKAQRESSERTRFADLWTAVRLVTAQQNQWLKNPTLDSPSNAEAFVRARIDEGSDYIKIHYEPDRPEFHPAISRETLEATVAAAHKNGKLAVVHVTQLSPARQAVAAGADGLMHVWSDEPVDDGLLESMVRRHTFVVPTLGVFIAGSTDERPWKNLLSDEHVAPWLSKEQLGSLTFFDTPEGSSLYARAFAERRTKGIRLDPATPRATVARLQASGVDVLAGTDAPNPGTAHGISLHAELGQLVRAGLTPIQALAAATRLPAERFRLKDRGRVAPGLRADLILLNGDPTKDISATRAISRIFKNGYEVDRTVPPPPPPPPLQQQSGRK